MGERITGTTARLLRWLCEDLGVDRALKEQRIAPVCLACVCLPVSYFVLLHRVAVPAVASLSMALIT
jgi:hypothetical protein